MKKGITAAISILLIALAAAQCSREPRTGTNRDTTDTAQSGAAAASPTARGDTTTHAEKGWKLVAYYFHGTIRCPTCLAIEKQSKEIVETEFASEVQRGTLVFLSLDYDEPANAHFADDYDLPSPSLVLSLRHDGTEVKWKNLREVWDLIHDPPAFHEYVTKELNEFLQEMQQTTGLQRTVAGSTGRHSRG